MQVTSMSLAFREAAFALDDKFCCLLNSNCFDEADELADRVALWDEKASECWHSDVEFARVN